MSSKKTKKIENVDFIERFEEVCKSSQPAEVARLLNISYQAAKNYLQGRLPDSNVLLSIAEQTPYSIHWLLTGKGERFAEVENLKKSRVELSHEVKKLIEVECEKAVNKILRIYVEDDEGTSIFVKTTEIMQERSDDEVNTSSSEENDDDSSKA